jgi:hypothetical protein
VKAQHLSDEAIAAFADDVLPGSARERASKHTATCAECAYAVAVQREAVWALRAATAPRLPVALVDRLRQVPVTTPISSVPSAFAADGSAMFSAGLPRAARVPLVHRMPSGSPMAAAFVPAVSAGQAATKIRAGELGEARRRHLRPIVTTAAAVAVAGIVVVGSTTAQSAATHPPTRTNPAARIQPADIVTSGGITGDLTIVQARFAARR